MTIKLRHLVAALALGALASFALGVLAQSGGYPTNARFRRVITGQPGGLTNPLALVARDGTGDAWIGFYENTALSTIKGVLGYAATGDDNIYISNTEAAAGSGIVFRGNNATAHLTWSPDQGTTNVDLTPASGTFTATFDDACTTSPTITFDYQRVGNIVVAALRSATGFNCTSDSSSFATTGTPIPAAARPAVDAVLGGPYGLVDDGIATDGCLVFTSTGNVVFQRRSASDCGGVNWTPSGTKSANSVVSDGWNFSYMLGNP